MLVQQCYYYSPQWLQCYFTTFLKKRIQQPLPVAQWASFLIRMLKPFTVQGRMTVPCIKIGSLGPRSLRETRSVWELDLHDWTESPCQIWQMLFQKQKQPARCCFLKCLALVGFSKISTQCCIFSLCRCECMQASLRIQKARHTPAHHYFVRSSACALASVKHLAASALCPKPDKPRAFSSSFLFQIQ